VARISRFIPGKHPASADAWSLLDEQEQMALREAIQQAAQFPVRRQEIEHAPKGWPGRWIGTQTFLLIPDTIVPYLELASVLHIGRQTHFGCGTFVIS